MQWLNYQHLHYFWLAAREGGISRAARQLRLTHTTVSEQVRAVEDALGEPLSISAERKIRHPAVLAICQAARAEFAKKMQ